MTTATRHDVKVGEFFADSWGYDQTNVDFYKVIAVTPAGVKVQKWTKTLAQDDKTDTYQSGYEPQVYVVPGEGPATTPDYSEYSFDPGSGLDEYEQRYLWGRDHQAPMPVEFHRLTGVPMGPDKYLQSIKVRGYSYAQRWDGRPMYETGIGWGH